MEKSNKKRKGRYSYKGFIYRLIFLFITVVILTAGYYVYKIYKFEKEITGEINYSRSEELQSVETKSTLMSTAKDIITSDYKKLKGEENGRINILLLGMGGEGHSGKHLTDTIMIASINTKTYETALLSIPRDLYVNIPEINIYTKINAVYTYELRRTQDSARAAESVKRVVQEITGQPINYYLSLDFEGFTKIIDEIGGIDIDVPEDIHDSRYPGPNFSYQTFKIEKGHHHLDGETALKYARVRHTTGGDFARAARQQAIIAATKRKAFSIKTIINPLKIGGLMNALGESLKTDIQLEEIASFLNLSKNINIYQTTNKVLDAWSENSLLAVSHVQLGGVRAFILIPRVDNYKEIQKLTKNIFEADFIEKQKEKIEAENANILLLTDHYSAPINSLLKKSGYKFKTGTHDQFNEICNNNTLILNNHPANSSEEVKLFTINDLATKLNSRTRDVSREEIEEEVVVCVNTENIKYFESQVSDFNSVKNELEEQSIIDKDGNLLFNEGR